MNPDRTQEVWIVRHTKILLVCWFVGLLVAMGCLIVWPAFERYVERLSEAHQVHAIRQELEMLRDSTAQMQVRFDALEDVLPAADPNDFLAWLGQQSTQVELDRSGETWSIMLTGDPMALFQMIQPLSGSFSGLELQWAQLNAEATEAQLSVRLMASGQPLRRVTDMKTQKSLGVLQFGEISSCPAFKVMNRLGDSVQVERDGEMQWLTLGERLAATWQVIGLRDQRLVFKSPIGGVCFSGGESG